LKNVEDTKEEKIKNDKMNEGEVEVKGQKSKHCKDYFLLDP